MKDLMTFSNEKFGTVRIVKIENEVWIVAAMLIPYKFRMAMNSSIWISERDVPMRRNTHSCGKSIVLAKLLHRRSVSGYFSVTLYGNCGREFWYAWNSSSDIGLNFMVRWASSCRAVKRLRSVVLFLRVFIIIIGVRLFM